LGCLPSAKNGSLKPSPEAFRFGIRYTLNDVLHFESFRTLDEAVANLKSRNMQFYASAIRGTQHGEHPKGR
jgi:hypothetical protein